MANQPRVMIGAAEYEYDCTCGWHGKESEIDRWDVQQDRDRVVRICPDCGESVPEWGTFGPIEGLIPLARGPLRDSLEAAGVAVEP